MPCYGSCPATESHKNVSPRRKKKSKNTKLKELQFELNFGFTKISNCDVEDRKPWYNPLSNGTHTAFAKVDEKKRPKMYLPNENIKLITFRSFLIARCFTFRVKFFRFTWQLFCIRMTAKVSGNISFINC